MIDYDIKMMPDRLFKVCILFVGKKFVISLNCKTIEEATALAEMNVYSMYVAMNKEGLKQLANYPEEEGE